MKSHTKFTKESTVEMMQPFCGTFIQVLFENPIVNKGGNTLIPKSAYNEWLIESGKLKCDYSLVEGDKEIPVECTMTLDEYWNDVEWRVRYADAKEYLLKLSGEDDEIAMNIVGAGIHHDFERKQRRA